MSVCTAARADTLFGSATQANVSKPTLRENKVRSAIFFMMFPPYRFAHPHKIRVQSSDKDGRKDGDESGVSDLSMPGVSIILKSPQLFALVGSAFARTARTQVSK